MGPCTRYKCIQACQYEGRTYQEGWLGPLPGSPPTDRFEVTEEDDYQPGGQGTKDLDGTWRPGCSYWDDLRVPLTSTEVNGSNPPTRALFKNDGNEIPGDAYALSFLATNLGNLVLPDDVTFDTSADFTFEFWLRPVVSTQNNLEIVRKQGIFDLEFSGTDQILLSVNGVGNALSSVAFNRGSWNYIVVTHDSTEEEIRLYINNVSAALILGSPADNNNDFRFNRQETLFDIDYIAYWDSLLSPAELTNRYASGAGAQLAGNEVGLKGLWELNDGSGTTVVEKTGISSDGNITGGSEGTHWDWIGGHVGNASPGSRGVVLAYFSPDTVNELYFEVQMPHAWLEGTPIRPHLHWVPNADGGVGEEMVWGLEYTWVSIGEVFGDTTTIKTTDAAASVPNGDYVKDTHTLSPLPEIDATGKTLSSMMCCRIFRDVDNASDTYGNFAGLLEIDFHYRIDSLGSGQEICK